MGGIFLDAIEYRAYVYHSSGYQTQLQESNSSCGHFEITVKVVKISKAMHVLDFTSYVCIKSLGANNLSQEQQISN